MPDDAPTTLDLGDAEPVEKVEPPEKASDKAPKDSARPKRSAPKKSTSTGRSRGRPRGGSIGKQAEQDVTALVTVIGVGLHTIAGTTGNAKLAFDGQIIVGGAPALGEAWGKLAADNPSVAKAIASLSTGSQFTGVVIATGMVLLPIMANHGLVPADMLGELAGQVPSTPDDLDPRHDPLGPTNVTPFPTP